MKRRTPQLVICAVVLALVPASALADATGATIDKTGWWNRANVTTPTPAGPVTVPPPPGIPEDGLVVGAVLDESTAVTAIGIQPDVGPGATVEQFTLRVTEDPDAEGNQGTDGAAIVACPIVDFWAGGANGDWETRPDVDCEAAAIAGTRDDEGVWEFDLTPIGELWFDPFATIVADGVLLRPDLEETNPFQAVFLGGDDIDVVFEAQPGAEGDDPFASPGFDDPVPTDSGLSNNSGSDGFASTPAVTSPPPGSFESPNLSEPADGATEEPASAGGDESASPPLADSPATEPVSSRAGDLAGNLSPLVYLGLLAFAALLVVMSYWLGPAGQPVTTVRQRGVSRALDARARATKGS